MDEFSRELNQLLVLAYRKIGKLEEGMLQAVNGVDLSITEMHMLEAVGEHKDMGLPLSELAQQMELKPPTITVAVNKLTKKGFVIKRKSLTDKRSTNVVLTRMGRKVYAAHRYFHEQMVRDIDHLLSASEREGLLRGMRLLNEFFQNALEEIENNKLEQRAKIENESV